MLLSCHEWWCINSILSKCVDNCLPVLLLSFQLLSHWLILRLLANASSMSAKGVNLVSVRHPREPLATSTSLRCRWKEQLPTFIRPPSPLTILTTLALRVVCSPVSVWKTFLVQLTLLPFQECVPFQDLMMTHLKSRREDGYILQCMLLFSSFVSF